MIQTCSLEVFVAVAESPIKLITGRKISCANWQIEGVLRMLHNNVVQGARPSDLIIYGGRGKAARDWECFHAIVKTLKSLKPDQTLLVQSGKPVGVVRTYTDAPRVLIVNSMLVPMWANDSTFWALEREGKTMYGQMTAGSWAFIGQQGIMQGTYETLMAAGVGPGTFFFSAGLGNMGGAQAVAGKMAGAATLIAEVDLNKIVRCQKEGWIDEGYVSIEQAVRRALHCKAKGVATAIAVEANVIDVLEWVLQHDLLPDIATDQTAAHDPLNGYIPQGLSFQDALNGRKEKPEAYIELSKASMAQHVTLLLELQAKGVTVFDYGNGIRFHAKEQGVENAFDIKGFVPLYIRPLFCQGRGPFRVASLTGNPADIAVIDKLILDLFGDNKLLVNWITKAKEHIDFTRQPGLPARVCWLGLGEREKAVEAIWREVCKGTIGPIWVGRDHLDCGSVASPGRETEDMLDGSDAIADWPILNALVSVASGATWTSVHDGGGVGIGKAIHSGQCFVITAGDACLQRALRVFQNDPALGVMRHADAGYPSAIDTAKEHGLIIPMMS